MKIHFHHFPKSLTSVLLRSARRALRHRKATAGEVNFIMVSDPEIRKLNRKFRRVNRITDVISFLYTARPLTGDIYIGRGRSQKQARQQKHPWDKELSYLVIHGVLHLFGYTDYTPEERRKMFAVQDRVWREVWSGGAKG